MTALAGPMGGFPVPTSHDHTCHLWGVGLDLPLHFSIVPNPWWGRVSRAPVAPRTVQITQVTCSGGDCVALRLSYILYTWNIKVKAHRLWSDLYTIFKRPLPSLVYDTHTIWAIDDHLSSRIQHIHHQVCGQLEPLRHHFCPPGTHHCWMGRGSMEWEVCPRLLYMKSNGNQTPDPLTVFQKPSGINFGLVSLVVTKSHVCYQLDRSGFKSCWGRIQWQCLWCIRPCLSLWMWVAPGD